MEAEHMPMSHPQPIGRMGMQGREALPPQEAGHHSDEKGWDRRGGMAGGSNAAPSYSSQGYPGHRGPRVETPFQRPESRETWVGGMPDMQGGTYEQAPGLISSRLNATSWTSARVW